MTVKSCNVKPSRQSHALTTTHHGTPKALKQHGHGHFDKLKHKGLNQTEAKMVRATVNNVQNNTVNNVQASTVNNNTNNINNINNVTNIQTSTVNNNVQTNTVNNNVQVNVQINLNQFQSDWCGTGSPNPAPNPCPPPLSCHPCPPVPQDSCHPQGSLQTSPNGVVTTPGGYKIEALGQHEWKITGPDNKTTRIWGDPHVDEGDGGKWDFKRDSTFVLGDGTRINCSTTPVNDKVTVTKGLEIISGNDRVQITDIDKGKGNTGPVTHDGFAHANSFGGKDVFVMGKETDDWSFQGKEVLGSNNNGETFNLGDALPAGVQAQGGGWKSFATGLGGAQGIAPGEPTPGMQNNPFMQQMQQVMAGLMSMFQQLSSQGNAFSNHCGQNPHLCGTGNTQMPWLDRRQQYLGQSLQDIGRMMDVASRMNDLTRGLQSLRANFNA